MKKGNVYYLAQNKNNYNRNDNTKGLKKIIIYIVLFICLIIFFTAAYIYLTSNPVIMVAADYKEIVDGFFSEGLLVRDEKKYYANQSGRIKILQGEGERVGYGQEIVKINDEVLYNRKPGLVSYATDGLEEELTLQSLDKITISKFSRYKRNYKQLVDDEYIEKGQAVFRIINNNALYIVVETDLKEIERYRYNEKVFIKPKDIKDKIFEAEVIKKISIGQEGFLVIRLDTFLKEWLNIRWAEFTFIKNIYRGIAIPRSAIFTDPDGEGVLTYQSDGGYRFIPVNVLNGNDEFVVVKGLEIGQKVITNPEDIDYGRGGAG